jgi:hypothetical protein
VRAPSADRLARLAVKYGQLGHLRRERERGEPVPHRDVFRHLAAEFPGCLLELDTLPLDEIDRRAAALQRVAEILTSGQEAAVEPWMAWLDGYHALLRAALWLKPRVGRRAPEGDEASRLAEAASAFAGVPVDAAFVRAIADPPGGRLVALVFATLEQMHRCPAATIRGALFPRSRR